MTGKLEALVLETLPRHVSRVYILPLAENIFTPRIIGSVKLLVIRLNHGIQPHQQPDNAANQPTIIANLVFDVC